MRTHFFSSIILSALLLGLCSGLYTVLVWSAAQLAPGKGNGFTVEQQGRTYYTGIGQLFVDDHYFWSRPSAVGYNAAGSGGSNKAPGNAEYLARVQARIDTVLAHNPGLTVDQIPADLVTASGSGLDPDISVVGATVQIKRIAHARGLPESVVMNLVEKQTEAPLFGLFGPSRINVLKLNLELDNIAVLK